jgi:hypothetical protein
MKYVFWIAIVVAVFTAGWRMLDPKITNVVFQDELQNLAQELDSRVGPSSRKSDEELRNIVIHLAEKHDIELDPQQLILRTSGLPEHRVFYISVHYAIPVNLLVYSYRLHFSYVREIRQNPLPYDAAPFP